MKRFVTYLYECQRGNKLKNVGFIRVNVRGEDVRLEVYIRNLAKQTDVGKIFALVHDGCLQGIELGEAKIKDGQGDSYIETKTNNIEAKGVSLQEIEGIGIQMESGIYIASCWKDTYAQEIVNSEFKGYDEEETLLENMCTNMEMSCVPQYEKIDLSQIRDLPSPNWHLTANSFLVHGFWNYGYLVLKKNLEKDKETLALGVPGIYEKPEAVMAVLFGFPDFEVLPEEMVIQEKEKNQETKEGTFGCWFTNLKL